MLNFRINLKNEIRLFLGLLLVIVYSYIWSVNTEVLSYEEQVYSLGQENNNNRFQSKITIVLKDSNWQDLAVQANQLASFPVRQFFDKGNFKVKKPGIYEFYIDISEIENKEIPEFIIVADGKKNLFLCKIGGITHQDTDERYIKAGEMGLEKGKYLIENQVSDIKNIGRDFKLILVNKKDKEKLEKEIWQRINASELEVCYIFEKKKGVFWVN